MSFVYFYFKGENDVSTKCQDVSKQVLQMHYKLVARAKLYFQLDP